MFENLQEESIGAVVLLETLATRRAVLLFLKKKKKEKKKSCIISFMNWAFVGLALRVIRQSL